MAKKNRQDLINFMADNKINIRTVMDKLNVSYQTVKCWRCKSGKDITTNNLKLLMLVCK